MTKDRTVVERYFGAKPDEINCWLIVCKKRK